MRIVISLLLFATIASGLDPNIGKERSCVDVKIDEGATFIDPWMHKVEKWFFVLMHKLEFVRTASDAMMKKVGDLPDLDFTKSCISIKDAATFRFEMFKNSGGSYNSDLSNPANMIFKAKENPYAVGGIHRILKTDKKSILIGTTCWDDNQLTWGVWSTKGTLTESERNDILDYLETFGYDRNYAVYAPIDPETCPHLFNKSNKKIKDEI